MIDHKLLLEKMSKYGICNDALSWFSNYLSNRSQVVNCNGGTSERKDIHTGVPQGSALGPFLFLIFVNDFPQALSEASSNFFADDCATYTSGKSFVETSQKLQTAVSEAEGWYRNNRLPLCTDKSFHFISSSERRLKNIPIYPNIQLNNENLKREMISPYLGMQLDGALKWNKHIKELCKKLNYKIFLLGRVKKFFNKKILSMLYKANIQPTTDYAISIWSFCSDNNKNLIRRLQHRAARIVCNDFDYINTRGETLMKELGWQTIEQRRDYFVSTLMYKCLNDMAPTRIMNEINKASDTHDVNTRLANTDDLYIPEPNCELFRHSFRYYGPSLWNGLPQALRDSPSIDAFKYNYKLQYFRC